MNTELKNHLQTSNCVVDAKNNIRKYGVTGPFLAVLKENDTLDSIMSRIGKDKENK